LIIILSIYYNFEDYLCEPKENIYQIEFVRFKIRDADSNVTLFEVAKSETQANETKQENEEASRFVRYNFSPEFLRLKTVGATYEFIDFNFSKSRIFSLNLIFQR
jgi:hypothetical protein